MDWRRESPEDAAVARGDFDGDGKEDEARLLVSSDGKNYGLFVFLASGPTVQLDSMEVGWLEVMGIETLPPGKHPTVCGKGYRDCQTGEPPILDLRLPGIDYFKSESANSAFYWSLPERRFLRSWLSD